MIRQPAGTPLELMYLARALVSVTEWFELGLQLGVARNVLIRIRREKEGKTERCKDEMLNEWLKNGLDHSWEEVERAVEEMRRRSEQERRRKEEKTRQQVEERKTLEAISQVQKLIETMNSLVDRCAEEKTKLAKKLKEEDKHWESLKRRWRNEDEQCIKREEIMRQMKDAVKAGDLESGFVKRYLREKSFPMHNSKHEVKCYLQKEMLSEEVVRVKELLTRHQFTKNHQSALMHIKDDAMEWIKQLEDHREMLKTDILESLQRMGLKHEKLSELEEHLEELGSTLRECESELENCDTAKEKTEGHLKECHQKLRVSGDALVWSLQALKHSSKELKLHAIKLEKSLGAYLVEGMVEGANAGAEYGRRLGELGEIVGGFAGGAAGIIAGAARATVGEDAGSTELRKRLETLKEEITANEQLWLECQKIEENVKQLQQTIAKIHVPTKL